MKKVKYLILLGIVLILFYVSFNLWQRSNKREMADEVKSTALLRNNEDMRLEEIHLVEEKYGKRTWELEAKQINQYQDRNVLILKDIKAKIYLKDGKIFNISGTEGRFYQDSKNMELSGNVELHSSDGYRLKTDSLFFDNSKKKISTEDFVEIEDGKVNIRGKGLVIDIEAKVFKLLGQVKTFWKGVN